MDIRFLSKTVTEASLLFKLLEEYAPETTTAAAMGLIVYAPLELDDLLDLVVRQKPLGRTFRGPCVFYRTGPSFACLEERRAPFVSLPQNGNVGQNVKRSRNCTCRGIVVVSPVRPKPTDVMLIGVTEKVPPVGT